MLHRSISTDSATKWSQLEQALVKIEAHLEQICDVYGLITCEQKLILRKDIKYLLLDHIAQEVKLTFYDRGKNINVLECLYTPQGVTETASGIGRNRYPSGVDIAIEVVFKFTDAFLSMGEDSQKLLLCNTDFEWYPEGNDTD